MAKREPIPKKLRFEVFKRDRFTCRYCGRKAPDVVLHVDHIDPVANGGTNEITNLVTACQDCNLGKGARLLSENEVMDKKRAQIEKQQEWLEQLEMMRQWELELFGVSDADVRAASCLLEDITGSATNTNGDIKLKDWIKKFGIETVLDAIRIACTQYSFSTSEQWEHAFSKIPGICWNKTHKSCNSCINAAEREYGEKKYIRKCLIPIPVINDDGTPTEWVTVDHNVSFASRCPNFVSRWS